MRHENCEWLKDNWKGKIYRSVNNRSLLVELVFSLYTTISFLLLVSLENWGALPYLFLFVIGYTYIFSLSLIHARR